MKRNMSIQLMGYFFFQIGKRELSQTCRKKIYKEYHRILSRAKDIGKWNPLLSCYALGAWFIAMNRANGLSPEKNYSILADGLQNSQIFRMVMGDGDHYLDPKRIEKQKKWAKGTKERRYENDWVAELLPGKESFDLGYDYLECGICKLCKDEGCEDLAKYLCKIDYLFADTMGLHLERTTTIAEGGEKCDFRFSRVK